MLVYKLLALMNLGLLNICANSRIAAKATNESDKKWYIRNMESKIVGGKPVQLERLPYSVQIFNLGGMCAGTILNTWTLLTAAHCFDMNDVVSDMMVQIGSRYIYDLNANQYYINNIVIHQKYNLSGLFSNDIALVFLNRPIEFGPTSKKAILVNTDKWMHPKEEEFIVTGWGLTEYGGEISKQGLMMVQLQFIPKWKCDQYHNITMPKGMFCLYGHGIRDTCKGDSGGGVYWHKMLVGIVSHGDGCAEFYKPSVYTNVYYYLNWIKKETLSYMNSHCTSKQSLS